MEAPATLAPAAPRPLIESLWLLVGLTFPLFSVEFFRWNDQQVLRISFAVPMIVMAVILAVAVAAAMVEGPVRQGPLISRPLGGVLYGLMFLFFIWHMASLIRSEDFKWGLREVTKLGMGMAAFWIVLALFPRNRQFLNRFWSIALWSSALLMAFLIYQYAYVFVKPFLGNNIDEPSRAGRNLLTWYLVFMLPCAVTRFIGSGRKHLDGLPLLVLAIAWIYAGSRGAWVSVLGGIFALLAILIKADPLRGLKVSASVIGGLVLATFASGWALANYVDLEELEYGKRLVSLLEPEAVPELQSSAIRVELMEEAFREFEDLPLIGIGLMNFTVRNELVTHNDFVSILAEMGIIGFTLFAGILACVLLLLFQGMGSMDSISLGVRASLIGIIISLCFTNAYTNMIFWIFLGLAIVVSETERHGMKDLPPCAE